MTVGPRGSIEWMRDYLTEKFDCTIRPIMGPDPGDSHEDSFLKRPIRCTSRGWEMEADPSHATKVVELLGLTGANTVASPSVKEPSPIECGAEPVSSANYSLL